MSLASPRVNVMFATPIPTREIGIFTAATKNSTPPLEDRGVAQGYPPLSFWTTNETGRRVWCPYASR